jgi:hypothetical protein
MHTRSVLALLTLALAPAALVSLAGCPSNKGEQKDAQTSSSGTAPATGPLANLEASPFASEVWRDEGGQQIPMIYFARENVRLSAPCRSGGGQLACEAIRYLRGGMHTEIARRTLDGRSSAGVKVCRKMNQEVIVLRNSVGAEDSVCRFPDGSLLSNGALEQYGMRVIE